MEAERYPDELDVGTRLLPPAANITTSARPQHTRAVRPVPRVLSIRAARKAQR